MHHAKTKKLMHLGVRSYPSFLPYRYPNKWKFFYEENFHIGDWSLSIAMERVHLLGHALVLLLADVDEYVHLL